MGTIARTSKNLMKMFYKMWRQEFSLERFKLRYYPPEDFTLSCWQKTERVLPIWVAYRTFVFLYFLVTLLYVAIPFGRNTHHEDDKYKFLIFLTNWTYVVESSQFFLAFFITVARYGKQKNIPQEMPMETTPWCYQLYWVLFTIALPCSMVVSVMFWVSVYDPALFPANATNIILHAFNSFFMLLDFAVVSHPVRFLHFYWPAFYGFLYGLFSVIYFFCGGTGVKGSIPIYKILDWRHPWRAIITCIICLSFVMVLHFLFALLSVCKIWSKKPGEHE